jgi:predicted MFS family arabinose efflux permease
VFRSVWLYRRPLLYEEDLSYGVMLLTLASLLSALPTSAQWLILFRVFQEIDTGIIFVMSLTIVTSFSDMQPEAFLVR